MPYTDDQIQGFVDRCDDNLKAARLLLQNSLYDAGANRAYYSAYSVGCVLLMKEDVEMDHDEYKNGYKHQTARDKIKAFTKNNTEVITALKKLIDHRIKADYRPDHLISKDLSESVKAAELIEQEVMGNV